MQFQIESRLLFLVTMVLACCLGPASCSSLPAGQSAARPAASQPSGVAALGGDLSASELVLMEGDKPAPNSLTKEERRELLRHVREDRHFDRAIWFVQVRRGWFSLGWSATVYFVPEEESPRYRKGTVLGVGDFVIGNWARWKNLDPETRNELVSPPTAYIQVSHPDHPFGASDILPDPMTRPFEMPEGLSSDDVVQLVDLVRHPPRLPERSADYTEYSMDNHFLQEAKTQPIQSITLWPDGMVDVDTGARRSGVVVQVKKSGTKWVVVGSGLWVS